MSVTQIIEFPSTEERLADLAARANDQHVAAAAAITSAIEHAIASGEALNEARSMLPDGEWGPWLAANFHGSQASAYRYMRFARYRDQIPSGTETFHRAEEALRGLERINGRTNGLVQTTPRHVRDEARQLYRSGAANMGELADRYGVARSTIHYWLHTEERKAKARARWRAGNKALTRQEAEAAATAAGGAVSRAYSFLRRTEQALDQATIEAETPEQRLALHDALTALYKAEDRISEALRGSQRRQAA